MRMKAVKIFETQETGHSEQNFPGHLHSHRQLISHHQLTLNSNGWKANQPNDPGQSNSFSLKVLEDEDEL